MPQLGSRNSGHRQPLKTNFPTVNVKSYRIRNSETVYYMLRNRIIDLLQHTTTDAQETVRCTGYDPMMNLNTLIE